jgi:ribosomal protein L29
MKNTNLETLEENLCRALRDMRVNPEVSRLLGVPHRINKLKRKISKVKSK